MPTGVSWAETLMVMQADGTALTTNNVSTSVINPQAKITLPQNFFNKIGKTLRIRGSGRVSTTSSATTTHVFSVLFGATTVFTSGFSNVAALATNLPLEFELYLVCRSIGSAATLFGFGRILAGTTTGITTMTGQLSAATPAVGNSFDATASQVIDTQMLIITTGITSIQLHNYIIESLN